MQRFLPYLLLFLLLSCQPPAFEIRTYHLNGYTLSDTLLAGPVRYRPYEADAGYYICYVGPATGNIATGRPLRRISTPDSTTGHLARKMDSNYMSLRVDTAATQLQFDHYNYDTLTNTRIVDSTSVYHAMRVTLQNNSDSLLFPGTGNFLKYMFLEMQNGKRDWIRIESPSCRNSYFSCGAPYNYLKPGEILIAKFPKYEGAYNANYRLVWQKPNAPRIISNEFVAPVNDLMLHVMELQMGRPDY